MCSSSTNGLLMWRTVKDLRIYMTCSNQLICPSFVDAVRRHEGIIGKLLHYKWQSRKHEPIHAESSSCLHSTRRTDRGFLGGAGGKEPANARDLRDLGSIPGSGRSLEAGIAITPVSLPAEAHGQRSLLGSSSWDHKEWGMTEAT